MTLIKESPDRVVLFWDDADNVDKTRVTYRYVCFRDRIYPIVPYKRNPTQIELRGPFSAGEIECEIEAVYYEDASTKIETGSSELIFSNIIYITDQGKLVTHHSVWACILLWTDKPLGGLSSWRYLQYV